MSIVGVIVVVGAMVTWQCPEYDVYEEELKPLAEQLRTPGTRSGAIEELLRIAEDKTRCYSTRRKALDELPADVPEGVIERVRILAERKEEPNEELLSFEPEGRFELRNDAVLTYWRMKAETLESVEEKKTLWLQLLRGENQPSAGLYLKYYALSVLRNFGDKQLLPELIDFSRSTRGDDRLSRDLQWYTETVVTLIDEHGPRFEAFRAGLEMPDITNTSMLTRWSIYGLGGVGTPEANEVLVNYARQLQEDNYDDDEHFVRHEYPNPSFDPFTTYNFVIGRLRENGWTAEQLNAAGLFPDKYFVIVW